MYQYFIIVYLLLLFISLVCILYISILLFYLLLLTPSVHKTVMRCFSSCAFFTENRIAVFTKDVQLLLEELYFIYYMTFIIEIH